MDSTRPIRDLFYAWHALEDSYGNRDIITCDLVGEQRKSFPYQSTSLMNRREELRDGFTSYLSHHDPRVVAKVRSAVTVLDVTLGQQYSIEDFGRNTIGVTPQPFSNSYLESVLSEVTYYANQLGFTFDSAGLDSYHEQNGLSCEQTRLAFIYLVEYSHQFAGYTRLLSDFDIMPDYTLVIKEDEASTYNAWIDSFPNEGIRLKVYAGNYGWTKGLIFRDMIHEIHAHAAQLNQWTLGIANGSIDPLFGLITNFGPEMVQFEGPAAVLYRCLNLDRLDVSAKLESSWGELVNLTRINILVSAFNGLDYDAYARFVPGLDFQGLTARASSPISLAYLLAYGAGVDSHLHFAKEASLADKRNFLNKTFSQPMLYDEIRTLVS